VNNALQARAKGRKLRIGIEAVKEEGVYRLSISDNGKGIDAEIRDKIFLPNFTTKTSGMGLGLAISQSIAEGMGGTIEYTTQSDRGTTFVITLPVHRP
jgi:two-component system, NtrC family, nitrogen regulation sensor histidine kinase NtrY